MAINKSKLVAANLFLLLDLTIKTQTAHAAVGKNVKSNVRRRAAIFYFINENVPRVRLKFGVR